MYFGFRPAFLDLGRTVISYGVQLVLLTATLAVRDEARFRELMGIHLFHTGTFRGHTTRPNIRYRVVLVDKPAEEKATLVRQVEEIVGVGGGGGGRRGNSGPETSVIVFCGRTSDAESLAGQYGWHLYHAEVDSAEGKERRLEEWMKSGGVMVATNALGLGLDNPKVRYVFHFGTPRQLQEFSQESGRGGRDGLESQSVIVTRRPATGAVREGEEAKLINANATDYVRGIAGCRRIYLDGVMRRRDGWPYGSAGL